MAPQRLYVVVLALQLFVVEDAVYVAVARGAQQRGAFEVLAVGAAALAAPLLCPGAGHEVVAGQALGGPSAQLAAWRLRVFNVGSHG